MKKIITLLLLTFSVCCAFSQDIITYKNGKTQKVVVMTTNEQNISCQDFETKEQFTISRSFISEIKYQEGKKEPFGVMLPKTQKQVSNKDSTSKADKISYTLPAYKSTLYKSFYELGFAGSLSKNVGSKFLLTTSQGLEFEDQLYVGALIGAAFEGSKSYGKKFVEVPENVLGGIVGLDLRLKVTKKDPYISIGGKFGGMLALSGDFDTGFFYHPNVSLATSAGKKTNWNVSLGYMGLPAIYYTTVNSYPTYNNVNASYLTITGGISF